MQSRRRENREKGILYTRYGVCMALSMDYANMAAACGLAPPTCRHGGAHALVPTHPRATADPHKSPHFLRTGRST
eukprot:7387636-Prymnesium_polylepis.1